MSCLRFAYAFKRLSIVTIISLFVPLNGSGQSLLPKKPLSSHDIRVYTNPGALPELKVKHHTDTIHFPLRHTKAEVDISGSIAKVELTQTYQNPFSAALEAIYVFPLPENSAVSGMKIRIGDRVIEAKIQERQEAKRTYEHAKQAGQTAALLEQERPNIFTQSIANIAPGTDIDVVIEYLQELTYDSGQYEFVFPMVVGPRFFPGRTLEQAPTRTHPQGQLDLESGAARISPPIFGKGDRSGNDILINLRVAGQAPIQSWNVPTHDVDRIFPEKNGLRLTLSPHDRIPNRDFILHYKTARPTPSLSLLTHRNSNTEDGFFTFTIQPPELDIEHLVGSREIIFVVDVSGSMFGVPLAMSQAAIKEAISKLRPVDTFNIYSFAGRTGRAFERPRPANKTNLQRGLRYISELRAGGGTQMADAVREALSPNVEENKRNRYVFFLTDGYVGNEKELFTGASQLVTRLNQKGQKARVFSFGVGSSVNRHLLEGLSKAGNGITVYASTREDPKIAVNKFFHYIDRPILENISIEWGQLGILAPANQEDLFASRPLTLHGRYSEAGQGQIVVHGEMAGRRVKFPLQVHLPEEDQGNSSLRSLWAREQIESLNRKTWAASSQNRTKIKQEITDIGLQFNLVTAYTSLVAVDSESHIATEDSRSIFQPVHSPEGVNALMAGGAVRGLSSSPMMMKSARSSSRQLRSLRNHPAIKLIQPYQVKNKRKLHSEPTEYLDSKTQETSIETELTAPKTYRKATLIEFLRRVFKKSKFTCSMKLDALKDAVSKMEIHVFFSETKQIQRVRVLHKLPQSYKLARSLEICLNRELESQRFTVPYGGSSPQVVFPATILFP